MQKTKDKLDLCFSENTVKGFDRFLDVPAGQRVISPNEGALVYNKSAEFRELSTGPFWTDQTGLTSQGPHKIIDGGRFEKISADEYEKLDTKDRSWHFPGEGQVLLNVTPDRLEVVAYTKPDFLARVATVKLQEENEIDGLSSAEDASTDAVTGKRTKKISRLEKTAYVAGAATVLVIAGLALWGGKGTKNGAHNTAKDSTENQSDYTNAQLNALRNTPDNYTYDMYKQLRDSLDQDKATAVSKKEIVPSTKNDAIDSDLSEFLKDSANYGNNQGKQNSTPKSQNQSSYQSSNQNEQSNQYPRNNQYNGYVNQYPYQQIPPMSRGFYMQMQGIIVEPFIVVEMRYESFQRWYYRRHHHFKNEWNGGFGGWHGHETVPHHNGGNYGFGGVLHHPDGGNQGSHAVRQNPNVRSSGRSFGFHRETAPNKVQNKHTFQMPMPMNHNQGVHNQPPRLDQSKQMHYTAPQVLRRNQQQPNHVPRSQHQEQGQHGQSLRGVLRHR